jgi:hypothetical protein
MQTFYNLHPFEILLSAALVDGRGAQATDYRDKVFAIVGMAATTVNPDHLKQ